MELIKFKNLTCEQIRRFPFAHEHMEFGCPAIENNAGFLNLIRLTMCKNKLPTEAQVVLAEETMKNLCWASRIHFITTFTRTTRHWPDFSPRFKTINQRLMPLVVEVFNEKYEKLRRERKQAYTGEYPAINKFISGTYYKNWFKANCDLIAADFSLVEKGMDFIISNYNFLEHGAIDAEIREFGSSSTKKVILFPDEIKLIP